MRVDHYVKQRKKSNSEEEEVSFSKKDNLICSTRYSGNTYLNVHTDKYPDGEVRGQIS